MAQDIIFCKTGGCGAKLGAGMLSRILGMLPQQEDEKLLVGFKGHDDAAVYKISEDTAIVSTLDFFPPMVEDPYTFGQIAAANALSDIYAMGGKPITALNIVCFPESMDMNILGRILQGGCDKVNEAGALLCGGHSISDSDIKYGLSVTGTIDPERVLCNNTCRPGDRLILSKPLGVGIINAAARAGAASKEQLDAAVEQMTKLNKYAAQILEGFEVHACTDVTGFGLLGHLKEMLGGELGAEVEFKNIQTLPGVYELAADFMITGAGQKNRHFAGETVEFLTDDYAAEEVLFDPQTSGGLLAAAAPQDADRIISELKAQGHICSLVGTVTGGNRIRVR